MNSYEYRTWCNHKKSDLEVQAVFRRLQKSRQYLPAGGQECRHPNKLKMNPFYDPDSIDIEAPTLEEAQLVVTAG